MSRSSPASRRPAWLRIVLVVAFLAAGYLATREREPPRRPAEKPSIPAAVPAEAPQEGADGSGETTVQVHDVVIRDLEGQVVFRGTVDLQPTLKRIAQGRRLNLRNDGGMFANREGRLPRQPAGHYKEYVHPTPGLSGPGPQ